MKKLVVFILAIAFSGAIFAQGKKITELPAVTSAVDASLLMVRDGASGNTISQINIGQVFNNRTLLGHTTIEGVTTTGATGTGNLVFSASPTLTGVPVAPTAAVGTSTTQVATTAYVQNEFAEGENLADLVTLKTDSATLIVFGAGSGLIADTALFNNNVLICAFYNSTTDTLVAVHLASVMYSGTGTETIDVQISWDANFIDGTPTNLGASAFTIAGAEALEGGAGEMDTSFANTKIPPNNWVWGRLSGASKDNKPTFLSCTLKCYRIANHTH
jgi:hypothetical protein